MSQDVDEVLETKSEKSESSKTDPKGSSATAGGSGSGGIGYVVMAFIFITVAIIFIGVGFDTMLTYDSGYGSSDKIVGGDAYNYIIRANRGIGYICAGVASSVISATFGALSVRSKLSTND